MKIGRCLMPQIGGVQNITIQFHGETNKGGL